MFTFVCWRWHTIAETVNRKPHFRLEYLLEKPPVKLLLIGDVVGKPGRRLITEGVPGLRKREAIDLIVTNAENAAGGSGLTPPIYHEMIAAGVDCITLGDHCFRRREIFSVIGSSPRIVRPANYPSESPGKGFTILTARDQTRVCVISLLGRVFMSPVDCPFHAVDRILNTIPADVKTILIDFHAEATSDMQVMGRYLDGRVSAVLGTHTHVATADEQIFPGGTAFQCDVGMTGPHESIIGRRIDRVLETVRTFRPTHFDVATEDARLHGTLVEVDPATGHATDIRRIVLRENEL